MFWIPNFLIWIYVILIVGVIASVGWYFFMKHRTKVRMYELELKWRRELEEKGINPSDTERIIEQRRQTYVLQHPYSRRFWPRE